MTKREWQLVLDVLLCSLCIFYIVWAWGDDKLREAELKARYPLQKWQYGGQHSESERCFTIKI